MYRRLYQRLIYVKFLRYVTYVFSKDEDLIFGERRQFSCIFSLRFIDIHVKLDTCRATRFRVIPRSFSCNGIVKTAYFRQKNIMAFRNINSSINIDLDIDMDIQESRTGTFKHAYIHVLLYLLCAFLVHMYFE